MKLFASIVGVLFILAGLAGVIFPEALLTVGQNLVTPTGLYVVAGLRVGIGFVFILAASASRLPKTIRVLGAIILVAGLVTPLVGADRSRAMLESWAAQGSVYIRMLAAVGIVIGAFITFVFVAPRRTA